jgi:hypothetical protein
MYDNHTWATDEMTVRIQVADAAVSIAYDIGMHPIAGSKFRSLTASGREAWIAWTWLFKQLIERGYDPQDAIDVRASAMDMQHDLGTYGAIVQCLTTM